MLMKMMLFHNDADENVRCDHNNNVDDTENCNYADNDSNMPGGQQHIIRTKYIDKSSNKLHLLKLC